MSPKDIVLGMQGDSDGDIVGLSNDPRHLELFKHLVDDRTYDVEASIVKRLDIAIDSREGEQYARYDRRGPIGLITRFRSAFLAVGDQWAATAMSLIAQQAVDQAKKIPEWFDYRAAAEGANWHQKNSKWTFSITAQPGDDLVNGTELNLKELSDWVSDRLKKSGGELSVGETVEWASNNPGKKIAGTWPTLEWDGGNMVHYCYRYAHKKWNQIERLFRMNDKPVPMENIVPGLLQAKGVKFTIYDMDWTTYQRGMRNHCGISNFGEEFKRIISRRNDDEDAEAHAQAEIGRITDNLQTDLVQWAWAEGEQHEAVSRLLSIYWNELKHEQGNINHAIRAIAWEGSPIMQTLGVTVSEECDFMSRVLRISGTNKRLTRIEKTVSWLMQKDRPIYEFSQLLYNESANEKHMNEKGIPLHECEDCQRMIGNSLVSALRKKGNHVEHDWYRKMATSLNHYLKRKSHFA